MKVLLYVCFILFVTDGATGQTPDPICANIVDFDECNPGNGKCDEKISKCICFEDQPFCQCNSKKGEFYIDENCSQRWTVTTFALVASLPGLTLAVLVGVIVYVLMLSSEKSHTGEEMKRHKTASKEQDLFPGTTFASDMNGRPPPNQRPLQQGHIQMAANRPYSPSSSVYQPAVKTDGRPRETNSIYNGMRDPPMGAPVQPYSTGAGRGQTVSNPYARDSTSQHPYEDHQDYRPQAPSHTYEDLQTQNRPYAPAPLYSSSEHGNPRNGFPRPQLNLQY